MKKSTCFFKFRAALANSRETFPGGFFAAIFLASTGLAFAPASGEVMKQATISRAVNSVEILSPEGSPQPAKPGETLSGGQSLQTGLKSLAELTFPDKTLARIGASSVFSFDSGTREFDLKSGALLLQVPKNAGGATIRTATVTAVTTGTTPIIESNPGSPVEAEVTVIEGEVEVFLNNQPGQVVRIPQGQRMRVPFGARQLPGTVRVDISQILRNSPLVSEGDEVAENPAVQEAIAEQQNENEPGAGAQPTTTWDQIEVDQATLEALQAALGPNPTVESLDAAYQAALLSDPQNAINISVAALNLLQTIVGANVPVTDAAFIDPAINLLENGVRTLAVVNNPPMQSVATLIGFGFQIAGASNAPSTATRLYNAAVDSLPQGPARQDQINNLGAAVGSTIGIGMPVAMTMQTVQLLNNTIAERAVNEGLSLQPITIPGTGGVGGNNPFGTTGAFTIGGPQGENAVIGTTRDTFPTPTPTPTPAPSPGPYGN